MYDGCTAGTCKQGVTAANTRWLFRPHAVSCTVFLSSSLHDASPESPDASARATTCFEFDFDFGAKKETKSGRLLVGSVVLVEMCVCVRVGGKRQKGLEVLVREGGRRRGWEYGRESGRETGCWWAPRIKKRKAWSTNRRAKAATYRPKITARHTRYTSLLIIFRALTRLFPGAFRMCVIARGLSCPRQLAPAAGCDHFAGRLQHWSHFGRGENVGRVRFRVRPRLRRQRREGPGSEH